MQNSAASAYRPAWTFEPNGSSSPASGFLEQRSCKAVIYLPSLIQDDSHAAPTTDEPDIEQERTRERKRLGACGFCSNRIHDGQKRPTQWRPHQPGIAGYRWHGVDARCERSLRDQAQAGRVSAPRIARIKQGTLQSHVDGFGTPQPGLRIHQHLPTRLDADG